MDLGCGDGRFAIAAGESGARALGYDIDDELVKKGWEEINAKNLKNSVWLEKRDIAEVNWDVATVIIVYLLPGSLRSLKDRLYEFLAKNRKIISIQWEIPDLKNQPGVEMEQFVVKNTSFFYKYSWRGSKNHLN
eukprot:comp22156_c0_seq3/m.51964 comp22156_c0_seq3/g.51964  ORF comp22156_c0_seq3/g.51964 comp22156_c0_seq3/m.51964 type:complete len:134 (-) comp22156_c0_seq3:120-521(-)